MQDNINEIKTWLKDNGHKYAWLAEKCHVKTSAVTNWFSKGIIPKDKLALIELLMKPDNQEEYFTISLSEENAKIVTAFLEKYPDVDLAQYCENQAMNFVKNLEREFDKYISPLPSLCQTTSKTATRPDIESIEHLPKKEFTLPVLGNIAAGGLMEGDIPETYNITSSEDYGKNHYCLRINGKSMEPNIPDGSHVIVKKWEESYLPKPGTIVVYYDGRGVTLKRLVKMKLPNKDSEYVLQSINPEFDDITPIDGGSISAVFVKVVR